MTLETLTPNLMVEDMATTLDFYESVLGFQIVHKVPVEPPYDWVMMGSGKVHLMFQTRESLVKELPALKDKPKGGSLTFYIGMTNLAGFFESIKNKTEVVSDLQETFYGRREFTIKDCNGYLITFSEEL